MLSEAGCVRSTGLSAEWATWGVPEIEAARQTEEHAAEVGLPGYVREEGNDEESSGKSYPEGDGYGYREYDHTQLRTEHCQARTHGKDGSRGADAYRVRRRQQYEKHVSHHSAEEVNDKETPLSD